MKTQFKKLDKVPGLGDIETPENNPVLLHYISPLELAAYQHKFKPFKYNLDGVMLDIEAYMCKELYWESKRRAIKLRALLQKSQQKVLKQNPELRRFLHMPIRQHNLPNRVYRLLKVNGCYNMADVAKKASMA